MASLNVERNCFFVHFYPATFVALLVRIRESLLCVRACTYIYVDFSKLVCYFRVYEIYIAIIRHDFCTVCKIFARIK